MIKPEPGFNQNPNPVIKPEPGFNQNLKPWVKPEPVIPKQVKTYPEPAYYQLQLLQTQFISGCNYCVVNFFFGLKSTNNFFSQKMPGLEDAIFREFHSNFLLHFNSQFFFANKNFNKFFGTFYSLSKMLTKNFVKFVK